MTPKPFLSYKRRNWLEFRFETIQPLHCWPRSRGSTGRTSIEPEGNMSFQSVVDGNLMAARTLCLLYVAAALGAWWILEQPVNSLMQELPSFQSFAKRVKVWRHNICMKDYGGPTSKPTWLYSGTSFHFWKILVFSFGVFAFVYASSLLNWFPILSQPSVLYYSFLWFVFWSYY